MSRLAGALGEAEASLRRALQLYEDRRMAPLAEQTRALLASLTGQHSPALKPSIGIAVGRRGAGDPLPSGPAAHRPVSATWHRAGALTCRPLRPLLPGVPAVTDIPLDLGQIP